MKGKSDGSFFKSKLRATERLRDEVDPTVGDGTGCGSDWLTGTGEEGTDARAPSWNVFVLSLPACLSSWLAALKRWITSGGDFEYEEAVPSSSLLGNFKFLGTLEAYLIVSWEHMWSILSEEEHHQPASQPARGIIEPIFFLQMIYDRLSPRDWRVLCLFVLPTIQKSMWMDVNLPVLLDATEIIPYVFSLSWVSYSTCCIL